MVYAKMSALVAALSSPVRLLDWIAAIPSPRALGATQALVAATAEAERVP